MTHTVLTSSGNRLIIDEATTVGDIRKGEPNFFHHPHGSHELFQVYRGALIVRNTVQFTGCKSERRTAIYLWVKDQEGNSWTHCVSAGHTLKGVRQAKKLVDKIIETKSYQYGMNF
jgi:hypothetical protein